MKFLLLAFSLAVLSFNCFADSVRVGDKDALVIIDMQPYFVNRGGNQDDEENKTKVKEINKNQIEAIKFAKSSKIPIIFIEYEGFGDTNAELKKEVEGYSETKYFQKNTDGMFSAYNKHRKELIEYLASKEVGNLIITGANGGACVYESINGSLENNYNVVAFSKGIADFNYKEFIYPYVHQYSFKPNCKDCKFQEADEMEVVVMELATQKNKNKNESVNDSGRDLGKVIIKSNDQEKGTEAISK